jgi:acid stress-induced BolA-like protein IbaG/YrbA
MSNVQDVVAEIQSALTRRLKLKTPRFKLESAGAKVSGSVISPSFRGIADSERQRLIWDALDREYGAASVQRAGTFLAFTPDEWDLNENSDTHE